MFSTYSGFDVLLCSNSCVVLTKNLTAFMTESKSRFIREMTVNMLKYDKCTNVDIAVNRKIECVTFRAVMIFTENLVANYYIGEPTYLRKP